MMRFAAWSMAQCRIHGVRGSGCPRMLNGLQRYCSARPPGRGGASGSSAATTGDSR
jgi:hypothetical protein